MGVASRWQSTHSKLGRPPQTPSGRPCIRGVERSTDNTIRDYARCLPAGGAPGVAGNHSGDNPSRAGRSWFGAVRGSRRPTWWLRCFRTLRDNRPITDQRSRRCPSVSESDDAGRAPAQAWNLATPTSLPPKPGRMCIASFCGWIRPPGWAIARKATRASPASAGTPDRWRFTIGFPRL